MSDLQEKLAAILHRVARRLREAGLPAELVERMEGLAKQVYQPCVVAVVGRVKVGKSTFVNALLRQDLAKVGTTETTATINYFTYGNPDPNHPVRCYWRSGKVTDESRAFLEGLQGNDLETLQRADGIDHLEYFLPNPLLKQITLVDTPGTGAVVEEHQNRTAEFMRLNNQLRDRHDRDTRRLVYMLASRELVREYDEDQLVDSSLNDLSSCTADERQAFDRPPYSGKLQIWDCRGDGSTIFKLGAAPESRDCAIVLQVKTYSEAEREAARHVLDTFEADCKRI